MKNIGLETYKEFAKQNPHNPSCLGKLNLGLQKVHRWRDKDDIVCTCLRKDQQQLSQVHSIMILPQVHLRKPCYDFYFL